MSEKNQETGLELLDRIHLFSIVTDVLKSLWAVLLGAIAVALLVNMAFTYRSETGYTYTTSTTLVVSTRGSGNVYANLSSAQNAASTFSNVMTSGIMQRLVCEDLGLESFTATATATRIEQTNLLVLKVSDSSPQRAYNVIRSIMNNYSTLTNEIGINCILEVLKEPEVPTAPDNYVNASAMAKRAFLYTFLLFTALFAVLSFCHETIKTSRDLSEKLDAKALGTVYFEQKYKTLSSMVKHKKTSILVTNPTASFSFVESYQKIASKLTYLKKERQGEVILFTSVLENEGKSTVAANVALTLAKYSDQVVLVDCDLRRPAQHLILDQVGKGKGDLPELLAGHKTVDDLLCYDEERGIYLLLSENGYRHSSELLAREELRALMKELRARFDYVIVDTPPLSAAADAEEVADSADYSVLVVRYNKLEARDINDAIDELSTAKAELAGCILNRAMNFPGLGAITHQYGYGYGYGYGSYGNYYASQSKVEGDHE